MLLDEGLRVLSSYKEINVKGLVWADANTFVFGDFDKLAMIDIRSNHKKDIVNLSEPCKSLLKHNDKVFVQSEGSVYQVDLTTGISKNIVICKKDVSGIISCFYVAENKLFIGTEIGNLNVFNLETEEKTCFQLHSDSITSITSTKSHVLTASLDRKIVQTSIF